MKTYKIIRVFFKGHDSEVIRTGLTLEEAQQHCKDSETSSTTCSNLDGLERLRVRGPWFDVYNEEKEGSK